MRNNYLLRKYGITEKQYETLLLQQDGRCAVCRRPAVQFKQRLAVDHDHFDGRIRGLLCNYCNRRVVGRYRKESSAELLKAAYDYLIKEYIGWIVPPKRKRKKHGSRLEKNNARKRTRKTSRNVR